MKIQLTLLLLSSTVFNAVAWMPLHHRMDDVVSSRQIGTHRTTTVRSRFGSTVSTKATDLSRLSKATHLHATQMEKSDNSRPFQLNWVHAAAWLTLVVFAFSPVAPGTLGSDQDNAMLQAIIDDPLHPEGINSIFYVLFNLFGPMPVILASLLLPQQSPGSKLPAGPFLVASSAIGYFAMGIYMAFRPIPESLQNSGWFDRNLAENKLMSWAMVAFCLYVYIPLPEALSTDMSGFVDLLSSSRFAAIASLDLTILYVVTTKAIADDYRLRIEDDASAASKVALGTAIVPYLGAALYCALRPQLPEEV